MPDGMSVEAGGAVSKQVPVRDFVSVSPSILRKLAMISSGEEPWFESFEHDEVRHVMNHLWRSILDRPLKSASCIGPDAFIGPEMASPARAGHPNDETEGQ